MDVVVARATGAGTLEAKLRVTTEHLVHHPLYLVEKVVERVVV
jgi:hypothetical protein